MPPKRKAIWEHFVEADGDPSKAVCKHCSRVISRGKAGNPRSKMTNHGMDSHLASKHYDEENERVQEDAAADRARQEEEEARRARDETAQGCVQIFSLRTKEQRREFLDMVSSATPFQKILLSILAAGDARHQPRHHLRRLRQGGRGQAQVGAVAHHHGHPAL